MLLQELTDPTMRNSRQETPLDLAALYGRLQVNDNATYTFPEINYEPWVHILHAKEPVVECCVELVFLIVQNDLMGFLILLKHLACSSQLGGVCSCIFYRFPS